MLKKPFLLESFLLREGVQISVGDPIIGIGPD